MERPKIINGICEFCGIQAFICPHYKGRVEENGMFLPGMEGVNEEIKESAPVIASNPFEKLVNEKIADIIIAHHDRHDMLYRLLQGIDVSIFNIRIIVGGSFGHNNNAGAKIAECEKMIFCNDDIIISNEQLIRIINELDEYDIVGATQIAGIHKPKKYWGIGLFKNKDESIRHQISITEDESIFPSGFLFGIKKKTWEKLNGFNEDFRTGNEDVDFGLRAMAMKLKTKVLDMEIIHSESQSLGRYNYCQQNEDLFYSIWRPKLKRIYNKIKNKK